MRQTPRSSRSSTAADLTLILQQGKRSTVAVSGSIAVAILMSCRGARHSSWTRQTARSSHSSTAADITLDTE
jgi:hypothetical protein